MLLSALVFKNGKINKSLKAMHLLLGIYLLTKQNFRGFI